MLTVDSLLDDLFEEFGIVDAPPETIPSAVDWIQNNFYIPETNAPIQLVPYQRAVIREGLSQTNGLFNYSLILWSDLKKSAKSTIAGAMSLYLAWHTAWETVRIVANDLKQADSRTFFYIERAIRLNPAWKDLCKINNYHIRLPNNTTLDAIPVDPHGEAGGGDLVTTFTEMWAMKSKAAQTLWSETTLSPLKFGKSIRIAESYAGFNGESPVLEPLYELGVKHGERLDLSFEDYEGYHDLKDLEVYRNGRTLVLWNTIPRCPWQTPEYYAQEESSLVPSEFRRIHRNQWADAVGAFISIEWWKACQATYSMNQGEQMIIGVDAATTSDCFAVVMVSRRGDSVYTHYCRVWYPPKGGEIDYEEPKKEIKRLINTYNIIELAYDAHQLVNMMQQLRNEEFVNARKFSQNDDRLVSDKRLYDMIRARQIHHNGESDLMAHMENASAEIDKHDSKLRIVKGNDATRKIDAVIALSMCTDRTFNYAFD